jgi:integrase/recombinase XerD
VVEQTGGDTEQRAGRRDAGCLSTTRYPERNRLIFRLSVKAGLRAKEIAKLTWRMTNDSQGDIARVIALQDSASKGRSGRHIPLNDEVREALIEYRSTVPHAGPHVICTERSFQTSAQMIVNLLQRWFRHLEFTGCSNHSGRRTFITNAAGTIGIVEHQRASGAGHRLQAKALNNDGRGSPKEYPTGDLASEGPFSRWPSLSPSST